MVHAREPRACERLLSMITKKAVRDERGSSMLSKLELEMRGKSNYSDRTCLKISFLTPEKV